MSINIYWKVIYIGYMDYEKRIGDIGQKFWKDNYEKLLQNTKVVGNLQKLQKVQGADYWSSCVYNNSFKYQGGHEIKAITAFVYRDNDDLDPHGTLGFQLWSHALIPQNMRTDGNKYFARNTWTKGALYQWLHPDIYNNSRQSMAYETKACQPQILSYILCGDKPEFSPYAAVVFEDFPKLKNRLQQVAQRDLKVDLQIWNLPHAANIKYWIYKKQHVIQNMWHVSLGDIGDLATVTMVDNIPMFKIKNKCDQETRNLRIKYLEQLANGRHIYTGE